MAGSAAVFSFEISLSDVSRGVYEQLSLKLAQHPSETMDYLLTRVFAYCMEYREGLEFTSGLSNPDEPAIWARDLTGKLVSWIEVGAPSVERLHKASKGVGRVAVYTYKDASLLLSQINGKGVHRAEQITLCAFEKNFLAELGAIVQRRSVMDVSISEGYLYVTLADKSFSSAVASYCFSA